MCFVHSIIFTFLPCAYSLINVRIDSHRREIAYRVKEKFQFNFFITFSSDRPCDVIVSNSTGLVTRVGLKITVFASMICLYCTYGKFFIFD